MGDEIRFVGGKHEGKAGWIDTSKKPTPKMFYVIVNEDDGTKTATRVMKESVVDAKRALVEPSTFEDACLQQHPEIDRMMDKLAERLAMCSVVPTDHLGTVFLKKLHKANTKQFNKGKKALWYKVDFSPQEQE